MKTPVGWALTISIAFLTAPPSASLAADQPTRDRQLQRALVAESDAFMEYWKKGDLPRLSAILAPDFVYAGPQGISSRQAALDVIRQCKLSAYSFRDLQMRRLSPDAAVLVYRLNQDLTCFGKKDPSVTLNSDTFVKRRGKWYIVLTTQTTLTSE